MRAGEADHAYHQCRYLAGKGIDVHVLTSQANQWTQDVPFAVHPIMRDWSWRDLPRLVHFIARCRPDAVFLFYIGWVYHEHPMITFAATVCRSILKGKPFVTMLAYPSGSNPRRFSQLGRVVRKLVQTWASPMDSSYEFGTLLRDSDWIIVMSHGHRAMLTDHYSNIEKQSVLVPPPPLLTMTTAVDAEARAATRARLRLSPSDFAIVYFGFIYPPKGVETVIQAFHRVSCRYPRARLVLIGGIIAREFPGRPRFAEEMYELPKQLGIHDKVIWTGEYETNSDDASRYLYAVDACAFAHDLGVAMNNSSFAACAAHGLPIVATKGVTLDEQFVDGSNVLLCPPKNPEAMAAALGRMIDDEDLRRRLQEGSKKLAAEWFSWDKATDRIVKSLAKTEG
jgi:glycosyltransferase involved in cell wall biosynthesis